MKYFHGLSHSILLASKKISKICKPEKCSFYVQCPKHGAKYFPEFPRSYLKWGTGTFSRYLIRDVGSSENMGASTYVKVYFFQKVIRFSNLQKTILNLKFKILTNNIILLWAGILNFKFRIVFGIYFGEIGRFEKRIALSAKNHL